MASWLRFAGGSRAVEVPITLTQFQILVAGFIEFIDIDSGDVMVINETLNESPQTNVIYHNTAATVIAGRPIVGDVVICNPSEVA